MKCFATIAILACVSLTRAEPPPPSSQYLPPTNNYLPPTQSYQPPSSNYLPPQRNAGPSNSYHAPAAGQISPPSSSYGAPSFGRQNGGGGGGGSYGASPSGYGHDEENYGPAKYEFKYDVQDYESGNDFGHMESRDGDLATGRYYVLLPDGRKQIVEYEADSNGYRPTIHYEEVGNGIGGGSGAGGYNKNAQPSGFGGYQ